MTVEKDYTIDYLMDCINQYFVKTDGLQNNKQKKAGVVSKVTSIQGKKIVIHLPSLGVLVDTKLTFAELKINTTSYLVFEFFD